MYKYINYKFLSENVAFDYSEERDNIQKETRILKKTKTGQFIVIAENSRRSKF